MTDAAELVKLADDCEMYSKVIRGLTVVVDDWQPGDPEQQEPSETLRKAAAALRLAAQQDGAREVTEDDIKDVHSVIAEALNQEGITFSGVRTAAKEILRRYRPS